MTKVNLPRYFVSRADSPPAVTLAEQFIPLHALDNFFAGGRHLQEQEWIVSMDASGVLRATNGDNIDALGNDIQTQIAFSEVANEGKIRLVETIEFYLFNIQLMEQAAGSPGLNDPVYLYGTLHGPYPQSASGEALAVDGQLTVTRADLLDALVQGAKYKFKAQGGGADEGTTTGMYHMVLAGDRNEETIRGAGYIFAYPLLPPDMMLYGSSNEMLISQYLYDILSGIRDDLEEENLKLPLRKMRLPVPNRIALEQDLEAQGYMIKGDTAIRKPSASGGLQGMVQSVFGSGRQDKLELPAQGSLTDFINLTEQVINSIPGWPPERTRIMRGKILPASSEVRMRAKGTTALRPREIKIPHSSSAPAPAVNTPSTTGGTRARQQPPGWMHDFIAQHQTKDDKGWVKLTESTGYSGTVSNNNFKGSTFSYSSNTSYYSDKVKPGWMDDFDQTDTANPANQPGAQPPAQTQPKRQETPAPAPKPAQDSNKTDKPKQSSNPDWMKDFE